MDKNKFIQTVTTAPIESGERGSKSSNYKPWMAQVGPEFCEVSFLYPLFGLRRTMTFRGIREGWFKSILLRQSGNKSGKRLVHVESVRQWLNSKMESEKS